MRPIRLALELLPTSEERHGPKPSFETTCAKYPGSLDRDDRARVRWEPFERPSDGIFARFHRRCAGTDVRVGIIATESACEGLFLRGPSFVRDDDAMASCRRRRRAQAHAAGPWDRDLDARGRGRRWRGRRLRRHGRRDGATLPRESPSRNGRWPASTRDGTMREARAHRPATTVDGTPVDRERAVGPRPSSR